MVFEAMDYHRNSYPMDKFPFENNFNMG